MRIKSSNLKLIVTAFLLAGLFWGPVRGDEAIDLLNRLQNAPESEAARLQKELEIIWARSGSPAMDLLLKRGRDALADGDAVTAIEHLTALTDHAPDFAEGWLARATAFYTAERYGPALDDLQRALELNPQNFNAIYGLGVMFQDFDDYQRANEAFQEVLRLHPHHEEAKTALEALKRHGIGRTL